MLNRIIITVSALFVLAAIAGCAGTANPENRIDYYTLEYAPPILDDLEPLPYSISIDAFSINPVYDTSRIVFRESTHLRETYVYHRWRAKPSVLAMYYLARDMRRSDLFKGVFIRGGGGNATHSVEGTIDEFYERDNSDGWDAVLEMTITLLVEKEPDISKRILFQRQYKATIKCPARSPQGVVEAMSTAMLEVSETFIRDLHATLKE